MIIIVCSFLFRTFSRFFRWPFVRLFFLRTRYERRCCERVVTSLLFCGFMIWYRIIVINWFDCVMYRMLAVLANGSSVLLICSAFNYPTFNFQPHQNNCSYSDRHPNIAQHSYQLEAIQRWSAICCVWPWTLTYQKLLLCVSSQGQDLYSH